MRRTVFLAAATTLLLAAAVHAQVVSVYGTFSGLHASGVETGATNVTTTGYQTQTTSFFAPGFGGGVTLNFLNLHVIKLGLDLRGSTKPGVTGADTALIGVKFTVQPPLLHLKPYVQASGGYLATRTTNVSSIGTGPAIVGGTFTNKYAAYEILGGIDYPLIPFLDLRIIEIGGGRATFDGTYNPSIFSVNSGLVLHF